MQKDKIIENMLHIIDRYDSNNISKNCILTCFQEKDCTITITLTTKGNTNKNTPFYFGNMYTFIIKEYWLNGEIINAEILYSTNPKG